MTNKNNNTITITIQFDPDTNLSHFLQICKEEYFKNLPHMSQYEMQKQITKSIDKMINKLSEEEVVPGYLKGYLQPIFNKFICYALNLEKITDITPELRPKAVHIMKLYEKYITTYLLYKKEDMINLRKENIKEKEYPLPTLELLHNACLKNNVRNTIRSILYQNATLSLEDVEIQAEIMAELIHMILPKQEIYYYATVNYQSKLKKYTQYRIKHGMFYDKNILQEFIYLLKDITKESKEIEQKEND